MKTKIFVLLYLSVTTLDISFQAVNNEAGSSTRSPSESNAQSVLETALKHSVSAL